LAPTLDCRAPPLNVAALRTTAIISVGDGGGQGTRKPYAFWERKEPGWIFKGGSLRVVKVSHVVRFLLVVVEAGLCGEGGEEEEEGKKFKRRRWELGRKNGTLMPTDSQDLSFLFFLRGGGARGRARSDSRDSGKRGCSRPTHVKKNSVILTSYGTFICHATQQRRGC
jgi:hypothetical protein